MAQNVGPILNMVTGKYLLRSRDEWRRARRRSRSSSGSSRPVDAADVPALGAPDDAELGRTAQGDHPLGQQPFTETIIREAGARARRATSGAS